MAENFNQDANDKNGSHKNSSDENNKALEDSDLGLARVLEDLIDLLSQKGVIQFTDLPEAAQEKLLSRKDLRKRAQKLDIVDEDTDEGFMP